MKNQKLKKSLKVSDLVGALRKKAPFDFAETWDNVGLLVGDEQAIVTGIVVAVNLGPEALEELSNKNANVLVCHHPPIFKPISKLTKSSSPYVYEALKQGISIIALHTNFDLSSDEIATMLGKRLNISFDGYLKEPDQTPRSNRLGKFITFAPANAIEELKAALFKAGAGELENYSNCSFESNGTGAFLPNQAASPKSGQIGKLNEVPEVKLEVIFPLNIKDKVVQAAQKAHPYETMAYDVIELAQPSKKIGYGFVGQASNLVFHKLVESVKSIFQLRSVTVVGEGLQEPEKVVKKIAFSPGSGSGFVRAAAAKGVEAYICGEVGYHQMLEARMLGVSLILLGHSYSEHFFVETIAKWCESLNKDLEVKIDIYKIFENIHDVM